MKIQVDNIRLRAGREGVEIYPLPTIQLVFNEYEEYIPKWSVRILWWWFKIDIHSTTYGVSMFE